MKQVMVELEYTYNTMIQCFTTTLQNLDSYLPTGLRGIGPGLSPGDSLTYVSASGSFTVKIRVWCLGEENLHISEVLLKERRKPNEEDNTSYRTDTRRAAGRDWKYKCQHS